MKFRIPGILTRDGLIPSEAVEEKIAAAISALEAKGIKPGDYVIVPMNLGIDGIYWIFACILSGRIIVPISPESTTRELEAFHHLLGNSHTVSEPVQAVNEANRIVVNPAIFAENRPCAVIFSSGSSGLPKGVVLSRKNFLASALIHAGLHGEDSSNLWLCNLPLYHIGGFSIPWRAFFLGQDFAFESTFDLNNAIEWIACDRVTHISMVPTMLHRILKRGSIKIGSRFKAVLLGGAHASDDLLSRAAEQKIPVLTTYGLTESCSQIVSSPHTFPRRERDGVGVFPASRIRISSEGEIQVKGDFLALGYLTVGAGLKGISNNEGYFSTGDLGRIDENGNLHILARKDDLIISGGINIFPQEIERTLLGHEAVENCCVVGVPDSEWGQRLAAVIELKSGFKCVDEAMLRDYLRPKLNTIKIPKSFLFVGKIPVTRNGKNIRHKVLELLEKNSS